ncbi:MAG: cytochrome c biogenesis protein CcsA [Verrucomicrobia bacterium]|nr:cytochrome c biogenesis protein CcsA [Verrucomicrobiota bacterium]
MKRFLPLLVLLVGVAMVVNTLLPHKQKSEFDLEGFGKLPVLVNGRIKPLDTVARTTLLTIQSRQRVSDPAISQPFASSPTEWLATVCFEPAKANSFPTFRIDSPELLSLMGITEDDTRIKYDSSAKRFMAILGFLPSTRARFSFDQFRPKLDELERQARLADEVDSAARNKFQKAVLTLYSNLITYQKLQYSLVLPESPDFLYELMQFQENLVKAVAAAKAREAGQPYDEAVLKAISESRNRFETLAQQGSLLAIPPRDPSKPEAWQKTGQSLVDVFHTGSIAPAALTYAGLSYTWRNNSPAEFNEIVRLYRNELVKRFAPQLTKSDTEDRFNAAEPFYTSIYLFVMAFFCGVFSWLLWPETLRKSGFYLIALAWVLTTIGIVTRMWIGGYAPVTNLYSSALGVCWVAVTLCIVLEMIFKNAIGTVAAGTMGFITLIIAHHLSLSGDTMEMMRAVLDSNFWLSTHVVTITIGYGATFLAGFLAIIYVFRGVFTRSLDKPTADALNRMVYGIVCFATLFSLVGTILGGIWADQSWGRFWGWDPKENGALIIVIWNALILHCRWGGLVKARGLMALAVFGNIVTAWSWFGVNMLGVGLHSYGFMDAAFWWLLLFVISQLLVIGIALVPLEKWRSLKTA